MFNLCTDDSDSENEAQGQNEIIEGTNADNEMEIDEGDKKETAEVSVFNWLYI